MSVQETQQVEVKVGDIWNSNWGYDETRIDFYQVVRVSAHSVWLQKIGAKVTEEGFMSRHKVPNTGIKHGQVFRRKLAKGWNGGAAMITSYEYASAWDGRPQYDSSGSR